MDSITSAELKQLENVLEIEVPKLRRMVGPSMGGEPVKVIEEN